MRERCGESGGAQAERRGRRARDVGWARFGQKERSMWTFSHPLASAQPLLLTFTDCDADMADYITLFLRQDLSECAFHFLCDCAICGEAER